MPCNDRTLDKAADLRAAGHTWGEVARQLGVNKNTIRRDFNDRRRRDGARTSSEAEALRPSVVEDDGVRVIEARQRWTVEQMAQAHGLDLAEWRCTRFQPGRWQQGQKDGNGDPVVVCLESARATFERMPPWLTRGPIQPGVVIPPPARRLKLDTERELVLLVPDLQVGLRRPVPDPTKPRPALEPTHHRAGIDLVVQAIAELKPDRVVWLGDNFDAEEFGSFRHGLGAVGTSDAALHEQHFIYEQARLAYPDARQHVIEGNHGFRVQRMLEDQARPASGLRRVGEASGALAIPSLLGLETLGVEYHGPYGTPSGDLWLWRDDPRLRTLCTHGRLTGPKPGALVAKLLPQLMHSHWQGHDHKAQWGALTRHDLPGPSRHIYCATPGALCRRDGALGSTRGGDEDWTGALGTITRVRGRAFHAIHPIEMDDSGRVASCVVGDRVLVGDAAGYEQRLHARWPGFGFLPG